MRKLAWITLLALVAPLARPALAVAPAQSPPVYREGEAIVQYREGAGAASSRELRETLGLTALRPLRHGRAELVALPRVTTTRDALRLLRGHPAVALAEPNFVRHARALPNDPLFGDLWGLHNTGQPNFVAGGPPGVAGADMDMIAAWDPDGDGIFQRTGDGSVTIAVIDDSVTTSHEDLVDNIVAGYDFANNDTNPNPDPNTDQQHGTLVAGAAAARGNNGKGVAGTAWNVKVMPLKFAFDVASHIAALDFARDHGAHIINASFGGPGFSQAEADAINDLAGNGILYVAAAGNDDSNTDVARLNYPANYDAPNIVAVAATNRQDNIASFSQYGALTTDVAAPGLQIVTTANGASSYLTSPGVSGTSFSAPYTAGIAALIRSVYPSAAYGEMRARLIEGAEPANGVNLRTAGGRVNAARSLDLSPRPALVIESVDWVDNNDVLDPGETLSVDITLRNLWQDATNVTGTLAADNGVSVASRADVAFGPIPGGSTATARFDLEVASGITQHRYVHFTLALGAGGGYAAERGFIAEIGRLALGTTVTQAFAARDVDLYDEFHAWHVDLTSLPAGHNELVIETTSSATGVNSPDIDLLVKHGAPPQYNITVGVNPEDPGFFCTSGTTENCQDPDTRISAGGNGNEQVAIRNPAPGTYHIVIVNFAQLDDGLTYTLRAYTRSGGGSITGGSGGGGAMPAAGLALLLALAALRRVRRAA